MPHKWQKDALILKNFEESWLKKMIIYSFAFRSHTGSRDIKLNNHGCGVHLTIVKSLLGYYSFRILV